MSFQSFNKHPQYRSVPHEAVELQPLSDGSGIGGLYNEVAQNETNAALKPTRVAETQLFRLENIGVPVCYLTVGVCQGMRLAPHPSSA